uniref:Uncharacterized protein n=1 Tax=Arundo donax TaxID=35708 RepID=A0A0A9H8L0_ARUDO
MAAVDYVCADEAVSHRDETRWWFLIGRGRQICCAQTGCST